MKNNLIAHNSRGSSDKVYVSSVRQETDGTWVAIGKWGRRGKTLQSQVKASGASESAARSEQNKLFSSKTKNGYEDIDSPSYSGQVDRDSLRNFLEPESNPEKKKKTGPKPKPKPDEIKKELEEKEFEVVCINNSGIENRFSKGIEYLAEVHSDTDMLFVVDKLGQRDEYFKDRFKIGHSDAVLGV